MNSEHHIVAIACGDYELLDSGDNMKLERYGAIIVARPETQALWTKQNSVLWAKAHATYRFKNQKGSWQIHKTVPNSWVVIRNGLPLIARLTNFKHLGIFPEQSPNWKWIGDVVRPASNMERTMSNMPKVLNLFGYTGAATIAAAKRDAFVTHVDASKQSLDWAHENAKFSNIEADKIRWILEDVSAFVKREVRRGAKYDGIILDPPAFGRGAKGEVWKIEEDLQKLLKSIKKILSDKKGSFFLLNGYASSYSSRSFAQIVKEVFPSIAENSCQYGEIYIKEVSTERVIPSGIYVRFVI